MSALIVASSKLADIHAGSSVVLTLADIRRCCTLEESVAGPDNHADGAASQAQPVVHVLHLVALALRRFRLIAQQRLSRADSFALARHHILLRRNEATGALAAGTPQQGYPLTWWLTAAVHWFTLAPLTDSAVAVRTGGRASEALQHSLRTPGRLSERAAAAASSTSLRRGAGKETPPFATAALPSPTQGTAGLLSAAPPAVARNLLSHGALLDAPLLPVPAVQLNPRDMERINEAIGLHIIPIPPAVEHLLCRGCRKLQLRVVQKQCCGACLCGPCAVLSVCKVCHEDAASVGPPAEYPERCSIIWALARELAVMYRTELAPAGRGSEAILTLPVALPLFR
jgi:hypothetical protein